MQRQPIVMIALPLIAVVSVLPPVLSMTPLAFSPNFNASQLVLVLPFYIGLIATPGYLYSWSGAASDSGRAIRLWVYLSLLASAAASIAGAVLTIPILLPVPIAAATAVCALVLLVRFRRATRTSSAA
jgi:hypothetical protein